jgi:hypothetical protein
VTNGVRESWRHLVNFPRSEPRSDNEPRVTVTPDFANKSVGLRVYVCRAMTGPNATVFSISSFSHVHGVRRLIFGALEIIRERFAVIEGQTCRARQFVITIDGYSPLTLTAFDAGIPFLCDIPNLAICESRGANRDKECRGCKSELDHIRLPIV